LVQFLSIHSPGLNECLTAFETLLTPPFAILAAMEPNDYPQIMSFVIRLVLEGPPSAEGNKPCYRGTIRHIQSNEDINFNTFDEAIKFIQRYVPLGTRPGQEGTQR
jgi:hypothetical protein